MAPVIPLYFAACLCVGSGALTLLAASAMRTGSRSLWSFFLLFAVLFVLVASNFVLFTLGTAVGARISPLMYALMILNKLLSGVFLMSGVLVAHTALDVPWQTGGSIAAGVTALGSAIVSALPSAFHYDPAGQAVAQRLALDPLGPVGLALILYTAFLLVFFRRRIADPYARGLATGLLIITAAFVPGFACDLFLMPDARIIASLPRALVFLPLFLAALSVFTITAAVRFLGRRSGPEQSSLDRVEAMERLARRHDLTAREMEIAVLMARGLGNKQIAWELGISERTVGNHIYSLYRKVSINSRFQLIGLITSKSA
jgi:DNA-binding CsgD family transcriptional regulator